ncbi:bacterio-opsin activator domain-containing protein [Saliphagus sp. LR7]|uniref:bacterio-opsin activator domain-containing protein n=1 Tax=Saliphagus sp. LR7 TaxID=2282654 RepID=UPI000DF844A8
MTTVFDILLVEDNPGDARLIEEMLRDTEELLNRIDVKDTADNERGASGPFDGVRIHHETRLSGGLERLEDVDPAVVLLDLDLPDSTGIDTLETVADAAGRIPIVVLTGLDDTEVGINAIQRGAHEYLVKGDLTEGLLVRSIHHALERVRATAERARRREQLESLNRLNRIVQDITNAAIRTRTRDELERVVCDRLVADDGYRFAWIGEVDRGTNRITPRISAGVEEPPAMISKPTDDESEEVPKRALETEAVRVVTDLEAGLDNEVSAGETARSMVAIPISYEELQYGVVCIHAADPDPFTDPEIRSLERLGDIIGHAIAAIERREALMSDAVLELEFKGEGIVGGLIPLAERSDTRIDIRRFVDIDERVLAYGTVEGVPRDRVRAAIEEGEDISDMRVLRGDDESFEVELVMRGRQDFFGTITSYGGRVKSATFADGEFRFVTQFPQGRDTRQLIEVIREQYPSAEFLAQRTSQQSDEDVAGIESPFQALTDRQRTVLETAYLAGYFDWPRTSSGEDVAERLGISAATFSEHLRAAERKLFAGIVDETESDDD